MVQTGGYGSGRCADLNISHKMCQSGINGRKMLCHLERNGREDESAEKSRWKKRISEINEPRKDCLIILGVHYTYFCSQT